MAACFRGDQTWGTVAKGIWRGYVTPWEIYRIIHANNVSLAAMNAELTRLDLRSEVPCVDVPVPFALGRYDRVTDSALAQLYFDDLRAPDKQLIWFDHSAHEIPFEEPDRFTAEVTRFVSAVGTDTKAKVV